MTKAAAVGRSYFVAWQTVINAMELMPGETILITGGAGMVGQAATAIARWRGAEPIVADRRRPDGVEHFIDTSSSDIREAVLELTDGRGADMALDTVGGALFDPALRSLRFDGRMVGIFSAPEPRVDFPVTDLQPAAAPEGTRQRVHGRGRRRAHLRPTPSAVRPRLPCPPAVKTRRWGAGKRPARQGLRITCPGDIGERVT